MEILCLAVLHGMMEGEIGWTNSMERYIHMNPKSNGVQLFNEYTDLSLSVNKQTHCHLYGQ